MDHYEELENTFDELEQERSDIVYDIRDVRTSGNIRVIKDILDKHGVVILTNAVSDQSLEDLNQNILDCAKKMYDIDATDVFDGLNDKRNPANGFGNASFSYFYKQPCSKDDTLSTDIGGDLTYLTENFGYQINLKLLEDNPHTASVLLSLTHPSGGMVSWDSFKLANNPKPKPKSMTKQTLTECHFDAYGGGINDDQNDGTDRYQAIISIEDKIKLGYVPDSINSKVKELLVKLTGKKNLYRKSGFKAIRDEKILRIFDRYIVAPPSGSLVLWRSGIIHYEAEFRRDDGDLFSFRSHQNLPNQKRIRCIVGTHRPQNLTQNELRELARLAENGLIPDMYLGINRDSKVYPNIMCGKSTQYRVYRKIEENKRKVLNEIISSKDLIVLNRVSNLKKYMYGIDQSIESLEVSDADRQMIIECIEDSNDSDYLNNTESSIETSPTKRIRTRKIASRNGSKRTTRI